MYRRGNQGGRLRLGHIRILYKAPTDYAEPHHADYTNRERLYEAPTDSTSPNILSRTPTDYTKPRHIIRSPNVLYTKPRRNI